MTSNEEYDRRRAGGVRPRRNIEFYDPDFDADTTPHEDYYPRPYGDRDDRYDDRDDRYDDRDGRYGDPYVDDRRYGDGRYEERYDDRYDDRATGYDEGYGREARDPQPAAPRDTDQGYRAGYRDGFLDNDSRNRGANPYPPQGGNGNGGYPPENNHDMDDEKSRGFVGRHPILMNVIYACLAAIVLVYMALWFLDLWTFHGQERVVPDVKGQSFEMAEANIDRAGLKMVVTDSVYDSYARPGTVAEQSPIPNSKIKKGGNVYLTIVAFTPKMVTIPDIYDVSERQARSMLEGLGITQVMTVAVPSEYEGLVMGAKFNGVALRPGARVPISAVITLEVGEGYDAFADSSNMLVDTLAIEETIEALNID